MCDYRSSMLEDRYMDTDFLSLSLSDCSWCRGSVDQHSERRKWITCFANCYDEMVDSRGERLFWRRGRRRDIMTLRLRLSEGLYCLFKINSAILAADRNRAVHLHRTRVETHGRGIQAIDLLLLGWRSGGVCLVFSWHSIIPESVLWLELLIGSQV